MKKNLALIFASLMLVMTAAGCGNKNTNKNTVSNTGAAGTQLADASDAYEETEVDMSAVVGDEGKSSDDKSDYSGKLGDYEITIESAKRFTEDDTDFVVVSITYKNKSGKDMPFVGALSADAYQNGSELRQSVVANIEGINLLSMSEAIPSGSEITVQNVYTLESASEPVTIEVTELYPSADEDIKLSKTFEF